MSDEVTINRITEDPRTEEVVLYLIEDGPWPETPDAWRARLKPIQDRVLAAFDVAVDGHLAEKFPGSKGKAVRIQVDSPFGTADRVEELIDVLSSFVIEDAEYGAALANSKFVSKVRIVTGHRLGRFFAAQE